MSSVAIVVLDTLRKDAFDDHFGWLPGQRYGSAYSTANWTVPAHASLFTGQYASEIGVHAKRLGFDTECPALAERLRNAGYRTRAFSANVNVTPVFGYDRGFDEFRAPVVPDEELFDWHGHLKRSSATGVARYVRAIAACTRSDAPTIRSLVQGVRFKLGWGGLSYGGTRTAREWVEETGFGEREFLFCNLMETHEPYRVPADYRTVPEPSLTQSVGDISLHEVDAARTRQAYDDCARYLSDTYRDLFAELRESFEYVITTSDHGELLGDHGGWGHEHGVYPELTRVPLCISGPEMDGHRRGAVSLLDVHETVLDIAGLESNTRGRSLFEDGHERERLAEYIGLTVNARRKLEQNGYADRVPTYDEPLRGYVAPDGTYGYETVDRFVPPTGRSECDHQRRLRALVDDLDVSGGTAEAVPERVQHLLRDLGYA